MEILFGGAISIVFQVVAILAAVLAFRLFFTDERTSKKAQEKYTSFSSVVRGGAKIRTSRLPDGIVRAGMVFNPKENRLEPNGKLSNDFVDHVAGC